MKKTLFVAMILGAAGAAGCFKGERTTPGTATRNAGTLSLVTARIESIYHELLAARGPTAPTV